MNIFDDDRQALRKRAIAFKQSLDIVIIEFSKAGKQHKLLNISAFKAGHSSRKFANDGTIVTFVEDSVEKASTLRYLRQK